MTPTLADLVDALVTRHSALANEPDPYWQGYRQALADIGANLARIVAATPQPSPAPPRRRDNSRSRSRSEAPAQDREFAIGEPVRLGRAVGTVAGLRKDMVLIAWPNKTKAWHPISAVARV